MNIDGELKNKKHILFFRVAYKDTDAGGVMYHGNYVTWAERARVGLWYLLKNDMKNDGIFVARKISAEYLAPIKLYDEIKIETEIIKIGNSSLTFRHSFIKNEKRMSKVEIVLVYINHEKFKPSRVPESWKKKFQIISNG
ncbi:MAG: hypothetical protein B6I23_00250 [Rickettsiaceae bacterium 4572_127]|nr:MAG: hypothetical protein B6I23_00250 [Rickettsiaceae bacterium 4572_127]